MCFKNLRKKKFCPENSGLTSDCAVNDNFLGMKTSVIFFSALPLVAMMMLASCASIPNAYNPLPDNLGTLTPPKVATFEPSGDPVPGESVKPRP